MKYFENNDAFREFWNKVDIESKLSALSRELHIPVRITQEPWEGLQIRLSSKQKTCSFGPKYWVLNADDVESAIRFVNLFEKVDSTMIHIVNDVVMDKKLGMNIGWLEPVDMDTMARRWKNYISFIEKHFVDFNEPYKVWPQDDTLEKNTAAWAARVILGGIKPSKIGLKLYKEHKVDIDKSGILRLKDKDAQTVWNFENSDTSEIDSFGFGSIVGIALQKAFSEKKDGYIRTEKVPEQWEIDANVYVGIEEPKKLFASNSKKK